MWPRTATAARAAGPAPPPRPRRLSRAATLLLSVWLAPGCARDAGCVPGPLSDAAALARIAAPPGATRQVEALVTAGPAASIGPPVTGKAPPPPGEVPDADAPVFSLADAIALGLRNNPRLRVAAEAVERARGQSEVAFAPFLPEADFLVRYGGTSSTLSPGAPGPTGGIIPARLQVPYDFAQAEADLQWTVWDFGRRTARYGVAMSRERVAALQLARAKQTVAFDVTTAYLGVLLTRAARETQLQAIRRARANLDDARSRRAAGVAEKDDVLRAELLVAQASDAAVTAGQAEYDAVARLNYALGRNPGLPLRVVARDSLPAFGTALDDCLRTAAVRREEVAIARESLAGARFGLREAETDFLPYIFLRLSVGYVDGDNVLSGFQEGAAVHANQKLFDGGRRLGERDSARAEVRSAAASADLTLDTIALEVHLAYRAVSATADRIRVSEVAVGQAAEYLRLVLVRYKNGNASPTDVVDAETAATASELSYQSAVYDHLAALARLDYAMGTPQGSLADAPPAGGPAPEEAPRPRPVPAPKPGG